MKKWILIGFLVLGVLVNVRNGNCGVSVPKYNWKTAIVVLDSMPAPNCVPGPLPTPTPFTERQSVQLALFAARQLEKLRKKTKEVKWHQYRIFFFSDPTAGREFQKYLDLPKRSEPLTTADYPKLTETWKLALVCVAFKAGTPERKIYYPQRDPSGWWKPLFAPQKITLEAQR